MWEDAVAEASTGHDNDFTDVWHDAVEKVDDMELRREVKKSGETTVHLAQDSTARKRTPQRSGMTLMSTATASQKTGMTLMGTASRSTPLVEDQRNLVRTTRGWDMTSLTRGMVLTLRR